MRAMAFEGGIADVEIEKGIVAEGDAVGLRGGIVEQAPKECERLAFRQDPGMDGLPQLEDERLDLLSELRSAAVEIPVQTHDGPGGRQTVADRRHRVAEHSARGPRLG